MDIFADKHPFSLRECYLDLLRLARWQDEPKRINIRNQIVQVNKNQVAVSIRDLSDRWSLSVNPTQRNLRILEENELIKIDRNNVINVISVLCITDTQNDTQNDTQSDTQNFAKSDTQNNFENQLVKGTFCNSSDTQNDTQSDTQKNVYHVSKSDTPIKNIKNIYNNKNNSPLSTCVRAYACEGENLTDKEREQKIIEMVETSNSFADELRTKCNDLKIPITEGFGLFEKFKRWCDKNRKYHKDVNDYENHFLDWLVEIHTPTPSKLGVDKETFERLMKEPDPED